MAVTEINSTTYANQLTGELGAEAEGKVRCLSVEFDQGDAAGDATSTQLIGLLPAGRIRILTNLSKIEFSAFGASRTLDVGFQAYKDEDSVDVAADADYFASAVDVSSAGSLVLDESGTPELSQAIDSLDGVVIFSTVAGGTIPVNATLKGHIFYIVE